MKKETKKHLTEFFKGLGVLILYLVSSLFAELFLVIFGIDYDTMPMLFKIIYSLAYEVLLVCIVIFIYKDTIEKHFKKFIKNNQKYFKEYIKYWFLALGLIFISNIIISKIVGTTTSTNQEEVINMFTKAPIYTFIITVIIAPILEELVFRLSFRKMFAKSHWLFIIASGLFFGSMHIIGTETTLLGCLYIIPYSIPGFIFAYTLIKSKNIFVPISLHFIHNGVTMALQILLLILT